MNKATSEYCESLRIVQTEKNRWTIANIIEGLADVAKAKERHDRALRLYLASKKIFDDVGGNEPNLEEEITTVRAELGEAEVQSAQEDVQHMTMEDAIEFALDDGVIAKSS